MSIVRNILAGFITTWLFGGLALGALGMLWTDATLLRLYVPEVGDLGDYGESVRLEILASDGSLLYRHDYSYGGRIADDCDISDAGFFMEQMRRQQGTGEQVPWWGQFFLKLERVDTGSLEGFVSDYYARFLLERSRFEGIQKQFLYYFTMEKLRKQYTNRELYTLYLDSVRYGANIHGLAGASAVYFHKDVGMLSSLELAYLIALVTVAADVPEEERRLYCDRTARQLVFELFQQGRLDLASYRDEMQRRIEFAPREYPMADVPVVNAVLTELARQPAVGLGERIVRVHTHYNPAATATAKKVIARACAKDDKLQAALVLVNAQTGGIEAAVGSRVEGSLRNRALFSKRQMGSTFKPIVYATAFDRKRKPTDQIVDKPYTFMIGGYSYKPRNYDGVFMGQIPLRHGITYSLNNASVLVAQQTGLKQVRQMAVNMGFQGNIQPFHSMALGAFATTPLSVAQIYATLANYGVYKEVSFIARVEDGEGAQISHERAPEHGTVDEVAAYQVMYVMQDVVRRGTARGAGLLPGTAAKTGTSDRSKDIWTAAICWPYVVVVWMGYDDYEPLPGGPTGGEKAAPIVAAFQKEYFGKNAKFEIKAPEGVEFASVRPTGQLAPGGGKGTYVEAFRKGYLPPEEKKTASRSGK